MCNTAIAPTTPPPPPNSNPNPLFKAETIAMVTAVSVKRGWFYECLTELDLETLRLRPSLLCSDPRHGKLPREAFLSHANHYVSVTVRLANPHTHSDVN